MGLFAGCASKLTTADFMRGYATEEQAQVDLKNQFAKDWERGQKLIESGTENIEDGEKRVESAGKDLERGKDQIKDGNREVIEGNKLVKDAEQRFREAFPDRELTPGK